MDWSDILLTGEGTACLRCSDRKFSSLTSQRCPTLPPIAVQTPWKHKQSVRGSPDSTGNDCVVTVPSSPACASQVTAYLCNARAPHEPAARQSHRVTATGAGGGPQLSRVRRGSSVITPQSLREVITPQSLREGLDMTSKRQIAAVNLRLLSPGGSQRSRWRAGSSGSADPVGPPGRCRTAR